MYNSMAKEKSSFSEDMQIANKQYENLDCLVSSLIHQTRRGNWTVEEDTNLIKVMSKPKSNEKKWADIATQATSGERSGKQCRERWTNHLNPELKRTRWTEEEERILIEKQSILGNKWTVIASYLNGRSENEVKNRWHSVITSRDKAVNSNTTSTAASSTDRKGKGHGGLAINTNKEQTAPVTYAGVQYRAPAVGSSRSTGTAPQYPHTPMSPFSPTVTTASSTGKRLREDAFHSDLDKAVLSTSKEDIINGGQLGSPQKRMSTENLEMILSTSSDILEGWTGELLRTTSTDSSDEYKSTNHKHTHLASPKGQYTGLELNSPTMMTTSSSIGSWGKADYLSVHSKQQAAKPDLLTDLLIKQGLTLDDRLSLVVAEIYLAQILEDKRILGEPMLKDSLVKKDFRPPFTPDKQQMPVSTNSSITGDEEDKMESHEDEEDKMESHEHQKSSITGDEEDKMESHEDEEDKMESHEHQKAMLAGKNKAAQDQLQQQQQADMENRMVIMNLKEIKYKRKLDRIEHAALCSQVPNRIGSFVNGSGSGSKNYSTIGGERDRVDAPSIHPTTFPLQAKTEDINLLLHFASPSRRKNAEHSAIPAQQNDQWAKMPPLSQEQLRHTAPSLTDTIDTCNTDGSNDMYNLLGDLMNSETGSISTSLSADSPRDQIKVAHVSDRNAEGGEGEWKGKKREKEMGVLPHLPPPPPLSPCPLNPG